MPLVSVVIPTHNRPEQLAEALASVRAQTFTDYEIIVVSNGESIRTQRESRAAAEMHGAAYFTRDEGNPSAARNFGVARAAGDWIAFLDDDDLWLPEKLEWQVTRADETGADLITADWQIFGPEGGRDVIRLRRPDGWSYTKAISHYAWFTLPSVALVRKSAFDAVGGCDPALVIDEDRDLWRRLSWRHSIHQTPEVLLRYRHGSVNEPRKVARYWLKHLAKMYRDTPPDLRHTLPPRWKLAPAWLVQAYAPDPVVAWLRALRPRYRLRMVRQWLRQRAAATRRQSMR